MAKWKITFKPAIDHPTRVIEADYYSTDDDHILFRRYPPTVLEGVTQSPAYFVLLAVEKSAVLMLEQV